MKRCDWAAKEVFWEYHDKEWGVPVTNDQLLFEMLILEGAQAGLSWETILKRRKNYQKTFHKFNVKKVALLSEKDVQKLLKNEGIIRNKLKIRGTIKNAKAFMDIQKEYGSFSAYLWDFVNHKPIVNRFSSYKEMPATSELSDRVSKDLKKRGFTFVGSTICYAFLQAVGVVNDHTLKCPRRKEIIRLYDDLF